MNLSYFANAAIQSINPNIPVTVRVPQGYAIDPLTRRQVPAFVDSVGTGQVQALDGDDLRQLDGLNIQGTIRALYLYGSVAGVIRPDMLPNAVVRFTSDEGGITQARDWGVFKVLEQWAGWCKVAVVYQDNIAVPPPVDPLTLTDQSGEFLTDALGNILITGITA